MPANPASKDRPADILDCAPIKPTTLHRVVQYCRVYVGQKLKHPHLLETLDKDTVNSRASPIVFAAATALHSQKSKPVCRMAERWEILARVRQRK